LFAILLLIQSYTIEKRRHMSGYHMERHGKNREDVQLVEAEVKAQDSHLEKQNANDTKLPLSDQAIDPAAVPKEPTLIQPNDEKASPVEKEKQATTKGTRFKEFIHKAPVGALGKLNLPSTDEEAVS
jgi:hypothetical protein